MFSCNASAVFIIEFWFSYDSLGSDFYLIVKEIFFLVNYGELRSEIKGDVRCDV